MKRLLVALCLLLAPIAAQAQSSKATIISDINTDFADNSTNAITAALLRTVTTEMVSSYVDYVTCGAQGGIVYWAASAVPTCLTAGQAGQVLVTGGGSANPSWSSTPILSALTTQGPVTLQGTSGQVGNNDGSIIISATGTFTLSLVTASTVPGRWLYIKSTVAQTVNSASSNVIGISSTGTTQTGILSNTAGKWGALQSNGSNWVVMMAN